ncbi:DUF4350 domain-containing protein [Cellulomonas soli]|uniref:DUF4350 domain-containing protein n=1 Tax=Cellulomonas soli TaxID=931535 RepID=A0A512P7X3_9CELL|nr:DUF4350 domain-containing protein [Cellulomonas soli]NYI57518.1 3',5'-cyclic AMP phosphodiesterase CpdA [Cellulomonas soli]GEP67295.1 hypothetical protein CSO01_00100 [Cellulomonas soli]
MPLALLAAVVLVGLLAALPEPRTSTVPVAPDNTAAGGARAAAQILRRQGVDVRFVRTTADAVAAADAGTTLLVVRDALLSDTQVEALADTPADLVLLAPGWSLPWFTDQITSAGWLSDAPTVRSASCTDADATAAGTITASGALMATGPDATICFPGAEDAPGTGAYAVVEGARRVAVLSDVTPLTNEALADEGNAALVLRLLGRHDTLVWYVPSLSDTGTTEATGPSLTDLLPPAAPVAALQLLLVALVTALWRGRRLGRLVTEPLPVVVRSAETTRGRGRLYRRGRSRGHAAAALRAGAATRAARRLGLPRSAPATAVIDALTLATGRDRVEIAALLYGPPPTDDAALTRLAHDLDHLESEVHRS